jgi:predicted SprT family Zn-dependent metalloprotease
MECPLSPTEIKEQEWTRVTIKRHCLCPACWKKGRAVKLRQPSRGGCYECETCGLKLRAVATYDCPLDIQ